MQGFDKNIPEGEVDEHILCTFLAQNNLFIEPLLFEEEVNDDKKCMRMCGILNTTAQLISSSDLPKEELRNKLLFLYSCGNLISSFRIDLTYEPLRKIIDETIEYYLWDLN